MAAGLLHSRRSSVASVPDRNQPLAGPDFEFHRLLASGGTFDLAVQFACYRPLSVAGIHLAVRARTAGDRCGHDPVVIAVGDLDIPSRWELRTSGLWAEQICELPDIHWSYGLEAFALQIDRPDELLRRGYGLRTPLGWEFDFEIESVDEGPTAGDQSLDGLDCGFFRQVGAVDGLILLGPDQFPLAGPAHRIHVWGDRGFVDGAMSDRSDLGCIADDGRQAGARTDVLLPTPTGAWRISFPDLSSGRPGAD